VRIDDLLQATGEWLRGTGPEAEIVISSRVRLARNLAGSSFVSRLDSEKRAEIGKRIRRTIEDAGLVDDGFYAELEETSSIDRKFLTERHLISREHEEGRGERGVAVDSHEMLSIMVNEEDHLRVQVLQSGLNLTAAWRIASRTDDALSEKLDFAFDPQFGYLTACPTNVGTGLRVSVMLHLAALALTQEIQKVFQAVTRLNLTVRGLYGEGTEALGHFYQISNQASLGNSEENIIQEIEAVIPNIIQYERLARGKLLQDDRRRLEDRVFRAYGMLRQARIIDSSETLMWLSLLRMGLTLGLIKIPVGVINELLLHTQPAHLQKRANAELDPPERDGRRADFIRERLSAADA